MGASTSMHMKHVEKQKKCGIICNCFINDANVADVNILRYCNLQWIWSPNHHHVLIETIKKNKYEIPNVILSIIEEFTFSNGEYWVIKKYHQCIEKYYKNYQKLLEKKLCPSYFAGSRQFTVMLIGQSK